MAKFPISVGLIALGCAEREQRFASKCLMIAMSDARLGAVYIPAVCDEIVIEFEYETFH
jgi:hypothetical protein